MLSSTWRLSITILSLFSAVGVTPVCTFAQTQNESALPGLQLSWSDNRYIPQLVSASWVWRSMVAGTTQGAPALRIKVKDGLPAWWSLKSARGSFVNVVGRQDGVLTIDLSDKLGSITFVFYNGTTGQDQTLTLVVNATVERTYSVKHKTCANFRLSVSLEANPGQAMYMGHSCEESENELLLYFVRSPGARWVVPKIESESEPRLSYRFRLRKSGLLKTTRRFKMSLRDNEGRVSSFFVRLEERPSDLHIPLETSFNGSAAARFFGGSRKFDERRNLLGAKISATQENRLYGFRSFLEGRLFVEELKAPKHTDFDFREGYIDWYPVDTLRLRAGKQIVAWGRADEINPTDVFTPRRNGLLTVDAASEQKTGALVAQARWEHGLIGSIEADFIPRLISSDLYWDGEQVVKEDFARSQLGAGMRWDRQWGNLETGLAMFNGIDPQGHIGLSSTLSRQQKFRRVNMIGGDGAFTFEQWAARWEAAHTAVISHDFSVGERRPETFLVLGLERKWNDGLGGVIAQSIYKHVDDFDEATFEQTRLAPVEQASRQLHVQAKKNVSAFSVRINRLFLNDTLDVEFLTLKEVGTDHYLLRPKISYTPVDNWKVQVGYEFYGGSDGDGLFSLLKRNKLSFIQLARHF